MLFSIFDTETTGLPYHKDADLRKQPRIIEFGGIITDGKEILNTLEFICDPGVHLDQVITDITGLTDAAVKGKPPFKAFIPQLKEYYGSTGARVSHNLSFDRSMLEFDLRRQGEGLDAIAWMPAIEICTVEQTFHQYGRRMKLTELYNIYCGPYVQKHRALDDVILLHEVCKAIGLYEAFQNS